MTLEGEQLASEQEPLLVKLKHLSRLFYMSKDQIEKVLLFSLESTLDQTVELNEIKMHEVLTGMELPPYRRVFTSSDFLIIANDEEIVRIKAEMPYIQLKIGKNTYKKYLDPDEMNVLLQARFSNWSSLTREIFESKLGGPAFADVDPSVELEHTFERNKPTSEEPALMTRHLDIQGSHSFAMKTCCEDP